MQMDCWQELANPRDLTKIFTTPEYAGWRSLRESEDARYLGLAMPRYLSRLPYGAKTSPVEEFDFEEDTGAADHSRYTWANAAYAMAVNINRSFKLYGWCSRIRGIESGGSVEGLPTHTFPTDDGGVDMKCPTEIAISDRREAELAKNGFMPLVHRKNSDFAAFIGAQSLQKPFEYDDPDATANANLAARLPYLFACCRFAHYLKCIVRDKIGSFKERDDMQIWLQNWIMNYVDGDPAHSSETTKAQKPLAAAEVQVEEVEGNPGYYSAKFFLRPHYQLEGLTVSLRLVSKLPSAKAQLICRGQPSTETHRRTGASLWQQTSSRRSATSRVNRSTPSTRTRSKCSRGPGECQQTGTMAYGGGGGEGKASFNDFNFMHHVDKASPVLMKACATGEHIKEATITVRKAGKGQQEFLIIKMNDILITSVKPSGTGDGGHVRRASRCSSPRSTWNTSRRRRTGRWMPGSISSTTSRATRKASRTRARTSRCRPS